MFRIFNLVTIWLELLWDECSFSTSNPISNTLSIMEYIYIQIIKTARSLINEIVHNHKSTTSIQSWPCNIVRKVSNELTAFLYLKLTHVLPRYGTMIVLYNKYPLKFFEGACQWTAILLIEDCLQRGIQPEHALHLQSHSECNENNFGTSFIAAMRHNRKGIKHITFEPSPRSQQKPFCPQ